MYLDMQCLLTSMLEKKGKTNNLVELAERPGQFMLIADVDGWS